VYKMNNIVSFGLYLGVALYFTSLLLPEGSSTKDVMRWIALVLLMVGAIVKLLPQRWH